MPKQPEPVSKKRLDSFRKDLLDLCKEHRVTLSLSLKYAPDAVQPQLAVLNSPKKKVKKTKK